MRAGIVGADPGDEPEPCRRVKEHMGFERPSWTPFFIVCGILLALAAVAGWQSWTNRTQEFRGTLISNVGRPCIPEDPCAIASLAMPGVTYELRFLSEGGSQSHPKLIDELTRLDGKNVVIKGKVVTWRYSFMKKPRSRLHTGIDVYEMRESP